MIRHTNSFIISMIIHALFIMSLFLLYKYISPSFSAKKEERVCVNLSCIVECAHKEQTIQEKPKPKPIEKKIIKKSKPKKIKKKIEPIKKKVFVKKPPKKVEKKIIEESVEEIIEIPTPTLPKQVTKSHVVVTPTESEVVIKETKVISAEKKYVDENLAKIAQLLQENLYYPRRARKRGIQGEVLVKFNLSTDAEVTDIEVLSSKSEILSRGAIRTINELSCQFPKPKENLTLRVPIMYKLN